MTTTEPATTWREYVDQMTAAQANRIGSLQRWIAAVGPITAAEANELAAIIGTTGVTMRPTLRDLLADVDPATITATDLRALFDLAEAAYASDSPLGQAMREQDAALLSAYRQDVTP